MTTFRPTHPGRTGGSSASGWRATAIRYQEIAEKMGMTEIQCRVRLFRLREKLKKFEETLGNL